ncbi:NAD-glutamate dehydrogenase domain-containing protein [Conexibacter sp. SYSU D00693]|uniref:NAD-glutamate dehydrogenase domain-containing protein n=1 Tax=Conexibacter sp. SYSU D00693 TaxID=2812560 RepID=UPI00196AE5D3|nr:NAD-glutamate dehydrogenase domain-containing protein [Conexibacter sp. SYSU D00693]
MSASTLDEGQQEGEGPAAAFLAMYTRRCADTDDRPVEELRAEARGALALAERRNGTPAAVRAFTPERERDGYATPGSVVETATDDLPFLVDSVTEALEARGHRVRRVVHPIVGVRRSAAGRLEAIGHPREMPRRESVMHFELERRAQPEELAALEDAVRQVLATVRVVVEDFPAMRDRLLRAADEVGDPEAAAFLRWLADDQVVLLGASGEPPLGLLREGGDDGTPPPPDDGTPLVFRRSERISTVHRRERLDEVLVRTPGGGTSRFMGLLTSRAYAEPASRTPLLAEKLRHVLEAEDLVEGSHDFKAAVHLFDTFPKDELFASDAEQLRRAISVLLSLRGSDVRLLGRRAATGHDAAFIAALPRPSYGPEVREGIVELLRRALDVDDVQVSEVLGEDDRVRVHLTVHDAGGLPEVDVRELEDEVRALARTWEDRLAEALVERHGDERGRMLAARWARRLPEAYRAVTGPALAVDDVRCFEELTASGRDLAVGLQDAGGRTRIAFHKRGPKVELSRATPMLEHLGLRVIEEQPARLAGDDELWVQSFTVLGPGDRPLALAECADRVADLLGAVWRGEAESDSLDRLVVLGGLDRHQVALLRAFRRYRQRLGSRYTEAFQNDVIAAYPELCAKQLALFELRHGAHGPDAPRDTAAEEALRAEVLEGLDAVELLDHDRILRNQLGLIDAIVRTNAYRPGRDALAFKVRSAQVPAMPQPAPLFEIYVYAADMEGIHLRGGKIARGGLRWSDRMDYRTEVFGLLRAQMTKNAVIVPAGAKGGFFLKARPDEPHALRTEVERQYVRYVEALLDVTDDLADDGRVVHPDGVRVLDEDDTYLVVAADKGTATFSDTANAVALRRGFWLGDAFASGGSDGYDHKALGITARGAWEAVKRHFRELGVDPETDRITAVGIGDMSGDVFGNGLLLSRSVQLVAAYDHRHVFLDPDPDPERSWQERRRLFELPGSTWADYDPEVLSEGAMVVPRGAKRVELTPQVRARLGIEGDEVLTPADVIRAVLRAPVDLLFNGGIGTVVKASTESDDDAQDRASDPIRVDARDLRCRVVGEGGNLGLTQRARVEASRSGVLCHADFIDNSAGVDCSDHEVNLKVLLDLAVRRGELDRDGRNALLREVTDHVTAHVLRDSAQQAAVLAKEVRRASSTLYAYEDLMAALEADGLLVRGDEGLPGADELADRRRAGAGLERPELAVLLAYAKRSLTAALLASPLPDQPWIAEPELRGYFPDPVVERFGHLLAEHPLRRELVATLVANDVVDSLGPTYVSRLAVERAVSPAAVVRAFRLARESTGAVERWAAVEALDRALRDRGAYWELVGGVDDLVEDTTRWWLTRQADEDPTAALATHRAGLEQLEAAMGELRSADWCARCDQEAERLEAAGAPARLARRHARQPALVHAPDLVAVAQATRREVLDVAGVAFGLGDALALDWLERACDELPAASRLQRWAVHAVRDDLLEARRVLTQRAVEEAPGASPADAVQAFLGRRAETGRRLQAFTRALSLDDAPADLAGLTLAVRHLQALRRPA